MYLFCTNCLPVQFFFKIKQIKYHHFIKINNKCNMVFYYLLFIIHRLLLKYFIFFVYVISDHNQLFFITLIINILFIIFTDNFLIYEWYINDNNLNTWYIYITYLKNEFNPTVIEININFHNWPIFLNYYSHK